MRPGLSPGRPLNQGRPDPPGETEFPARHCEHKERSSQNGGIRRVPPFLLPRRTAANVFAFLHASRYFPAILTRFANATA